MGVERGRLLRRRRRPRTRRCPPGRARSSFSASAAETTSRSYSSPSSVRTCPRSGDVTSTYTTELNPWATADAAARSRTPAATAARTSGTDSMSNGVSHGLAAHAVCRGRADAGERCVNDAATAARRRRQEVGASARHPKDDLLALSTRALRSARDGRDGRAGRRLRLRRRLVRAARQAHRRRHPRPGVRRPRRAARPGGDDHAAPRLLGRGPPVEGLPRGAAHRGRRRPDQDAGGRGDEVGRAGGRRASRPSPPRDPDQFIPSITQGHGPGARPDHQRRQRPRRPARPWSPRTTSTSSSSSSAPNWPSPPTT